MSKYQTFDGVPIEKFDGRLTGTFELEESEVRLTSTDGVIVGVFVARTRAAKDDVTKSGDVKRSFTYALNEVKFLTDSVLRDQVIIGAGLYTSDTLFGNLPEGTNSPADGTVPVTAVTDVTDVTVPGEGADPDDDDMFDEGSIVETIEPEPAPREAPSPRGDGPKVAKFNATEAETDPRDNATPDEVEVVGTLYGKPRDKALTRFLERV